MSDKIKTLSQAIRLGATFRPQSLVTYFDNGESCALGAAEAMGAEYDEDFDCWPADDKLLSERFPLAVPLFSTITDRNDRGETREQIADWLEAQGL